MRMPHPHLVTIPIVLSRVLQRRRLHVLKQIVAKDSASKFALVMALKNSTQFVQYAFIGVFFLPLSRLLLFFHVHFVCWCFLLSSAYEEAMVLEAKAVQNMYNRMTDMCFKKCISRFGEGELAAGETTCIDRCCLKYIQTQQKVSIKLNPEGAAAQGLTPQ